MTGYHTAVPVVLFERGQNPRENGGWPAHVVVSKERNCGSHFRDRSGHLAPFIGVRDREQANSGFGRRHRAQHSLGSSSIGRDSHQKDLGGSVFQNRPDCLYQFLPTSFQRGDNHRDILGGQLRGFRWRHRLEAPEGDEIDHEAEVAIETTGALELMPHAGGRIHHRRKLGMSVLTKARRMLSGKEMPWRPRMFSDWFSRSIFPPSKIFDLVVLQTISAKVSYLGKSENCLFLPRARSDGLADKARGSKTNVGEDTASSANQSQGKERGSGKRKEKKEEDIGTWLASKEINL